MTNPTIHLALVDDWELSGNGSGDIRELQFEPMRRLVSIYERLGIRGSFNAEVMQQLTFRQLQDVQPELKVLADEWDNIVTDTFGRVTTYSCTYTHSGRTHNTKTANGNSQVTGRF